MNQINKLDSMPRVPGQPKQNARVTDRAQSQPASFSAEMTQPDAELTRLGKEFRKWLGAYKLVPDDNPVSNVVYEAYWEAIDKMVKLPAQTNIGIAEKSRVIREYTLESDALDKLVESLIADCIRLGEGVTSVPSDAELIAACDQYFTLNRHLASYGDEDIPSDEVALVALSGLTTRISVLRATSLEGHAARARVAMDIHPGAFRCLSDYENGAMLQAMLRDLMDGGVA